MNDETDKKVRARSPEFPYLSLREAIPKLELMIGQYQRHAARIKNLAPLWNFKPSSSSFLRNVAALRSFGLVDETGSGEDRKISVSDLGMKVAMDKRPGAAEAAIKKAFENCTILNEYRQKWAPRRPPDMECLSELTLDQGFTEVAARKFISVYDDSVAFIEGLDADTAEAGREAMDDKDPPVFDVGMYVQWEQGGVLQLERAAKLLGFSADGKYAFVEGSTAGIPRSELIASEAPLPSAGTKQSTGGGSNPRRSDMIEATYPIAEGTCTLIYPGQISEKSAKRLKRWLDLMLEDVSEIAGITPKDDI